MEKNIKDKSKNQKEISIVIDPDEIREYGEKAAEIISSESVIDGFRPGKAPKQIVEEKLGKERVWKESCYQALNKTYSEVMKDNDFFIVSHPEVEIQSMEIDEPFSYKITITTMPEITLPDYKKIAGEILKEKKEVEVSEEDVDKALESIRKSRAKVKSVSRESREGDELMIDFQGSIDGVKQESLKAEKMIFVLGEQSFIDGFGKELIGIKEGDNKEFSLEIDMPDFPGDKMSKQKVDFEIKVHSVGEREIPELNDEFVKSLGNFLDLNDLKKKIKENIRIEKDHREKELLRIKIVEAIEKKMSTDIPEVMIQKELDNMINEFKEQLSGSGLSFSEYLKKANKDENQIRKDWDGKAKKRILTGLILYEIAKKEGINVNEEELKRETDNYLNRFRDHREEELPDPEKLRNYIKDIIRNEKVFQFLES